MVPLSWLSVDVIYRYRQDLSICGYAVVIFTFCISNRKCHRCASFALYHDGFRVHECPCRIRKMIDRETLSFTILFIDEDRLIAVSSRAFSGHEGRCRLEIGEVDQRYVHERVYRECEYGRGHQCKGCIFPLSVLAELARREEVCGKQYAEDDVLDECLHMGQVNCLTEASAVHLRVEYDQQECQQGKESLKDDGRQCDCLPPYSCD